MENRRLVPVVMAVAGCTAIVIGVYQGLVHVAPGYEGTITAGWGGDLNREEILLVQLGVVGVGGAVAALRWKRLASVPFATGGIVLFYAFRAVGPFLRSPTRPLYREFSPGAPGFEGESVMLVLGAEPFLLAGGGLLLVGAGIAASRFRTPGDEGDELTPPPSRA
ncbi:hypothetical protein M0R88_10770 [Halorussus gelatinilyticus]|uniref:Uncharacterized protein n=1 Tax=Halorussus gelatinilyticus TaxID=2937524 RepID=A0A8U0IG25_9EURY|nr:hypothetical protein [Halorussus gelatinilyticus]UPV99008.1 hypothetical protein M0R88_10770 [Halorussus gelatinilyticus]